MFLIGVLSWGVSVFGCQQLAQLREFCRFHVEDVLLARESALFHLVAVFPLSYNQLFIGQGQVRFLLIEALGAMVCVGATVASGILADKVGRRAVLGVSAGALRRPLIRVDVANTSVGF